MAITKLQTNSDYDSTWYIDTGATQHMAYDRNIFTSYKSWDKGNVVFLGDNFSHDICGEGEVKITLKNGEEKTIPEVLYVPDLKKNLFSIKQFDRVGGTLIIKK